MSDSIIQSEKTIRVTVADSDEPSRNELCERLGKYGGLLVKAAADWRELRTQLDEDPCDVVIVSGAVGGVSGIEINQNIKTLCKDPPATIMLEVPGNAYAVIKAFRCGFADYVPKESRRDSELRDAVIRASQAVAAERERAQRNRDLEKLAQLDRATGLPNRYYLRERLEQLVEVGRRHRVGFGVILIRVNNLDDIRSGFGSKVADGVLYAFAKRLQASARKSATYGRLDDDRFLYLLERELTEESLAGACARLTEAMTFSLELETVGLALSATVTASVFPEDGLSTDELLQAAELRMRDAPCFAPEGAPFALGVERETFSGGAVAETLGEPEANHRTLAEAAFPPGGTLRRAEYSIGSEATGGSHQPAPFPFAATRLGDRRDAVRRRCLKRGVLVFNNGFSTVNCIIRDLSDTGARIEVEGSFDALEWFELRLVETGKHFRIEKRWQNGSKFGLRFLS